MIDKTIEKKQCTGCQMCGDLCSRDAISFEVDKEGFWYPVVDYDKCIKCGLCQKKCPSLNFRTNSDNHDPKVFAAWIKDDEMRVNSTSGGVFWAFASNWIKEGGVAVGVRYGDDWKSAQGMVAHDLNELMLIKGSKYFQSNSAGIYKSILKEIDSGKRVLFCGTPCQNAAVRGFLGKKSDDVMFVDFICRSINSPLAFKAYINELEKAYDSEVDYVQLKNKDGGWQSLASKVVFKNGKQSVRDKSNDWWVNGFIRNDLYTRESCYNCLYKVLPRASADITIGDFWGIKGKSDEDMFKGISVVMLNSEKGIEFWNRFNEGLEYENHTIEEVLPGNPALIKNPIRSKKQDQFFNNIEKYPFSISVKKCIRKNMIRRLISKVYRKIKYSGGLRDEGK